MSAATPSGAWATWFRLQYRVIRWLDPLIRAWLGRPGLADTVDLVVVGRRSGRPRPVLVGLLVVDGRWYVGHPNGDVHWTRNLEAAGEAVVRKPGHLPIAVPAAKLPPGRERSAAIRATFAQHPFPGNAVYRLAHRHIERVGVFFRLEPGGGATKGSSVLHTGMPEGSAARAGRRAASRMSVGRP